MGLENGDPAFVTSRSSNSQQHEPLLFSRTNDPFSTEEFSPQTKAAIAERIALDSTLGTKDNPIHFVYDDNGVVDDDVTIVSPPRNPVWEQTHSLIERMASLEPEDSFNLRIPMDGESTAPEGFIGPGLFEPMVISGTHKNSFLQLVNQHTVLPDNWRLSFPSRAMGASSPLHYPKSRLEYAIQDAKEQKMFIALHIFSTTSDTSDLYNMIICRDDVQNIYADSFIPYYTSMTTAVELSAMSRLLSPSLQRRPPPLTPPIVLLLATIQGRLNILGAIDSAAGSVEYTQKLKLLRELYLPELRQEEQLEIARQQEARLIDEQNSDYERAVKEDEQRAKAEADAAAVAAAEEAEAQEAIEAATRYAAEMEEQQAKSRANQRQSYIEKLASLPAEPTEGKNATIALRLIDGTKVQRKFNPDTTTLADIFTFAAGQIALKATDDGFTLPSNTDLAWNISNFDLSAQFPARRFSHNQETKTLRELGLVSQELLNLVDNN